MFEASCREAQVGASRPTLFQARRRDLRSVHGDSGSDDEALNAPEKLRPDHELTPFVSGTPAFDGWLRRRCPPNQESSASLTYVIGAGVHVVGYYALAAREVAQAEATGRTRRNMPESLPVMAIRRHAIDSGYQGLGLGRALLRDAGQALIGDNDACSRATSTRRLPRPGAAAKSRLGAPHLKGDRIPCCDVYTIGPWDWLATATRWQR